MQLMFSLKVYKKTAQTEKATHGFTFFFFFFPFQSYQEQSIGLYNTFEK